MLRLGLIGAGRWGKVYIRTIESLGPRLKLVRVATSKPEGSWKDLVTASDCDAVIIATPAPFHAEMTRACLAAGKPVLAEKPLCFDADTARSIKLQAEQAKLPVLVNYVHLFNPAYQAFKKTVAASGRPIRAVLTEGMDLGPFRAETPMLWDRCPHDVALCLDLLGNPEGAEVAAAGAFPDGQGHPEMAALRLSWKNGVNAWIQAGRLSTQKKRSVTVVTDTTLFHWDDQAAIKCRRVPFNYDGRTSLGSAPLPKEGEPVPMPSQPAPMEALLSAFADQAEKKAPPAGLALTVELTRVLEECAKLLKR